MEMNCRSGPRAIAPVKSRALATPVAAPHLCADGTKILPMSETLQQPGLNSLSKSFEPAAIEARWEPEWEQRGYARAGHRGTGAPKAGERAFAIQLPPPNVTGTLHMGHAFNQTIMDSLTRYHRMRGHNTVWVPGTDHAGIATQIVVERQLQ